MAYDLGPDGVRVNAICPGYIDTPMLRSFLDGDEPDVRADDLARWQQAVRDIHPLRRYGEPADIANLVTWLASEEAGTRQVSSGCSTVASPHRLTRCGSENRFRFRRSRSLSD